MTAWWLGLLLGCGGSDDDGAGGSDEPTEPAPLTDSVASSGETGVVEAPSHLLMISIDTFRRDALTRYGGDGSMPFLDGLAAEARIADDHATCSNWTFHSTTCTMRGAYPEDWGFVPGFSLMGPTEVVPEGTPMLATWLGEEGFTSAMVTTNNLFSSAHGNAQGFDTMVVSPRLGFTEAQVAAEEALVELRRLSDAERRYVHLHLMEPHQPYDPPLEYLDALQPLGPIPYDLTTKEGHNQALQDITYDTIDAATRALVIDHMTIRYQGELAWLDHQLAAFWTTLGDEGFLDDTLVVVWTDHGEQFYERGYQAHAWTLFDEEQAGLFFLWGSGVTPGVHEGPTSSIDIVPTVLERLGVAVPAVVDGLALGRAPADRPRFGLSVGKGGVFQSVLLGDDRLHVGWTDPDEAPPFAPFAHGIARFDRVADPEEVVDLAGPSDPRTLELWGLLQDRMDRVEALTGQSPHVPAGYARE